ncbi:MAG: CotH kinase family protein [Chitinophagaceae bacterium]|nr:CotH kinase family protein [Chitinophagaceae bacterium]
MNYRIILLALSLLSVFELHAQTFTATPNQACGEGSNLVFNLPVSGVNPTSNVNNGFYEVCITLNHNQAADVRIALESPSGTYKWLTYNNGGNNAFTSACFRLYADHSIRYQSAPFSGSYMAYDDLRNYTDGQNPNGTWKLHYLDNNTNSITGTLVSWSVTFAPNPHMASINASNTNLPIFKIDVPLGYVPDDPKTNGTLKIINNASAVNAFNATVYTEQFNLAIEKQGFTSAWNDKPNYDFEFQNYNYSSDTSVALLGMPKESDWILKACVTDEYMMKDPLTFEMSRRMKYYAPRTRFVEVMLNGEYVGMYILTEKMKRDSARINIAKLNPWDTSGVELTGGYIFEINPNGDPPAWYSNYLGYQYQNLTSTYEYKVVYPKQSTLPIQQLNYIHSFVDSFEDALAGPNFQDPNIGWRKYADEDDLIDFLIVSEYSTNYDTYGRSTYLYKEKSTDGNKIHCGPPWDSDRGYCCTNDWVHIVTHGYWIFPFWWQKLRTDTLFNERLACRFMSLRQNVLTDAAFLNYIDSTQTIIQDAVQRNVNRWQNTLYNIVDLKNNVTGRLAWMQSQFPNTVFPPLPLTTVSYCQGSPVDIFIGNQYSYNFIPGPDTSYYVPPVAGTYQAEVGSNYGCKTLQTFTITPHPDPIIMGNAYPCRNTAETYTVMSIQGANYVWTVNGGTPIAGCGAADSFCTVQWGNPTFCMVTVKQSLTATCSDTDIHPITIQTCSGVNDEELNSMTIYPSPVKDKLFIQCDFNIQEVTIYDATGRIIFRSGSESTIDVSGIPAALYLIKIRSQEGKEYIGRFVKE